MNKRLLYALPVVLIASAVAAWLLWPQPKVSVKTGTVVMCTQGEMISDDTRVIQVDADELSSFGVKTKVITCDRHQRLAELREKVSTTLAAGNLAAARAALEEIVKLDPSDRGSSEMLESVKAGKKPKPIPASSGDNTPDDPPADEGTPGGDGDGDQTPTGPNAGLLHYVPDTLTGFVAQGIVDDPFVLWRDYVPASSGAVVQLVVMAEQHGSPSEAQSAIDRDVKSYYPDSDSTLSVSGRKAYFGTRNRLAVLAMTDGSVRVVLEATCGSDNPASLKTVLVEAATQVLN